MSMANSMIDIMYQDFPNICRTCLSRHSLIPLTQCFLPGGVSVEETLRKLVPSMDLTNNELPQQICELCIDLVTNLQNFIITCNNNETFFKTLLQELPRSATPTTETFIKDCDSDGCPNWTLDDELPLLNRLKKNTTDKIKRFKKGRKKKIDGENRKKSTNNSDNNYTCQRCKKSFSYKYKLVMHFRVHTKEKPFKCDKCNLSFSLNGNLKRHKMIHSGERPHLCKICGKGFIQITSLRVHTQIHNNDKLLNKLECTICDRVFIRDKAFKMHMKKHHPTTLEEDSVSFNSDDAPKLEHKCEICGKKFAKVTLLRRHVTRHGEKKFLCSDCGKGFVRKADLQSHAKVHTGEKPHTCQICNKSFAHSGSLVTHNLQHTGQKLFQCQTCTKSFSQVSHLKVHQRTHSGERPYSCTFCKKTFALKSNLTVHIRTHTGETPFLCNVCGKGFYDSSSMKKHKNTHLEAVKVEQPVVLHDTGS